MVAHREKVPVQVGSTILLLNSTYQPLTMLSWKRATVLVLKSKAHVISSRTIRLKNFVKVPQPKMLKSKPTRSLILKRDRHVCQYCGYTGDKFTIDHVIPKSRGGGETWQNLVASCIDCNNCKDNRTPEEWAICLKKIFDKETTYTMPLPLSWSSFQMGMLESRIRSQGTTLVSKPRVPFNRISVTISTSEVEEWREYLFI